MRETTTVTFSKASLLQRFPTSDGLILEQEDWDPGVGYITKLQLVNFLDARFYGGTDYNVECDIEDGSFLTVINAYPYQPSLAYSIGVTHGQFQEYKVSSPEEQEIVTFSQTSTTLARYPVHSFLDYEWQGKVWDPYGNEITPPTLNILSDNITFDCGTPVVGTVKVVYKTLKHSRLLRVTAREDEVENVYSSVVWANWHGGVELLVVAAPNGAEDDYSNDEDCSDRTFPTVEITPPDPSDSIPDAGPVFETTEIDYCTQTAIEHQV